MSNLGITLVGLGLWASVSYLGFQKVLMLYGAPWLWTNHWIRKLLFFIFLSNFMLTPSLGKKKDTWWWESYDTNANAKIIIIVAITFLQHTDPALPYYPTSTWSFLRGAASTIDRDFGFIGRFFFHSAIDCHVLHHHASRIPFYHAVEASDAIKKVMGSHYQSDIKSPFMWAFWKNYRTCRFVQEKDVGSRVYFFAQ